MKKQKMRWLPHLGIGGRLFLAFVLISSITILVSVLSAHTFLNLRDKLQLLQQQDIPGLEAAARLNDKSRLIVATAPLLVTAESNVLRQQAMAQLSDAISSMDVLMRNLADYDHYFRELIAQISNSVNLLYQSVERREQLNREQQLQSQRIFPLFNQVIAGIEQLPGWDNDSGKVAVLNKLHYFAGLVEKAANDTTFNQLDYTFLRLEVMEAQINLHLSRAPQRFFGSELQAQLNRLLIIGNRSGDLFKLQNQQLDSRYQQSYLLQNSLDHIRQLAAQVNLYTDSTNERIGNSLKREIASINRNMQSSLVLSLASFLVALAISWFYVRRNVLQRILELQHNMRSIASAKLDTDIRIVGNDEVSSMARDLKHFQNTAIEVERTNKRLAAEIEERVQAEKQLKETQNELIQAAKLAALGQLSVGITHEISQPLTAISSHLHIAGLRLAKGELQAVKHTHSKIASLLKKTGLIIRHLKSFTHRAGTELLAVDIHQVIGEALELMSNRLRDQHCQICYAPSADTPAVLAEPIRLEQVLVNLLSNAIDATQDCAKRDITIKVIPKTDLLYLQVTDNGIGIAPEHLTAVFNPFYTHRESGEGLGLGLSISESIVQGFGGQIQVSSTLGSGSCFTVILKLAEAV
ncbi:MAG: GHKL domain-containing protein [Oceanospirillaceae bacterium]|nr:GHKL domain-containing protein [Oceanospirillaceae bacterium]